MSSQATTTTPAGVGTRLRDPLVVGIFVGAFLGLVGLATLALEIREGPGTTCAPGQACPPPIGSPPTVPGTVWRSEELGFELEYDPGRWSVTRQDARTLELAADSVRLVVEGSPETDAQLLLQQRVDSWRSELPNLDLNVPHRQPLGANIGYLDGTGAAYCGTPDDGSGPSGQADLVVLSATDGSIAVVVSALTDDCAKDSRELSWADTVLNTVRWPGDSPSSS